MRKTKFWLLGIILALIYSCSDDFETKEQSPQGLDISDVRSYFEKNATDLAPLMFSNPLSRSTNLEIPELVPEWDNAIKSENEDYLITEVPLNSPSRLVCVESVAKDNKFLDKEEIMYCQRRLVVARQKDKDEVDMFVATLVPDKEFIVGENASFTGRVFYSELNGDFRKAVKYYNGQVQDTLLISKGYGFAIHTQKGSPLDYSTLAFQEESTLRSSTYSNSEGGGGGWDPGWGGGGGSIGGGGTGGGNIGGGSTGGGTGSGGYDSDYLRGLEAVNKMQEDMRCQNVSVFGVKRTPVGEAIIDVAGIGATGPGIITSCFKFMQESNLDEMALKFGKAIGWAGLIVSGLQTYIAISKGDYSLNTIVSAVSTALSAVAIFCTAWPIVAGIAGVSACAIGLVSTVVSLTKALLIEVPMENGEYIYVYIPANSSLVA